ncbi:gluconate:H+ symporter [Rhodocytophaga aerolata]|uniref:Gluconate:H+ symporter n=1 Tax=Rhodocytophaga aerolata TaxID=455078 RepID=A0ABT8RBP8_9BACT|nr:gluconate:H+ symporter [Rhodocytophaga aerolata]MDO1448749.1 gluconate:H+ symporter [Rhodocytophaga aerolata]
MPLVIVVFGVLFLLLLMIGFKLNAFLALILASMAVGIAEGMTPAAVITSIQNGVGSTLGSLALIIGFGAMLGNLVAESGAAQRITFRLIKSFGVARIHWAMVITGFVVGIPLFYNAGFVLLIPIVFTLAASTGLPLVYVGMPMAAALSVTHGFLPPHPGPTAIAVIFKADIGLTLVYGIILAIPTIVLAGPVFASFLKGIQANPPEGLYKIKKFEEDELPGYGISLFTALVPILLMAVASLINVFIPDSSELKPIITFIGDPVIALLVAVLVAIFTLGLNRGKTMPEVMQIISSAITGIAMILLIIGGGGALKQVLVDSGVGTYIAELGKESNFSPLVLAWSISALLRVCLGSATVAGLTAAGIVLPVMQSTGANPELMVLATGAGSLMLSHVNDPGFWMFKEYFGLTLPQTFSSWTLMETIVSVMGLLGVLLLNIFL